MRKVVEDPNEGKWVKLSEIAPKDIRIEVRRGEVKRKRRARVEIAKLDKAWTILSENIWVWREPNEAVRIKERFKKVRLSFQDQYNILIEIYFAGKPRLIKYNVDDLIIMLGSDSYVSFQRTIGKDWYHISISASYTPEQSRN